MDLLLAIDAGTTSVKAGLFAPDGRMLALRREEYRLDTPSVERAQLDPQMYWQACVRTVRRVVEQAGVRPEQIHALGVSSQGETTITLGRDGQALYPALVWLDNRAVEQAAALALRILRPGLRCLRRSRADPHLDGLQAALAARK